MSTQAEELERMVIRLVGDSSHYLKTLEKAERRTKEFATNASSFVNPTVMGGSVQDTWAKQDAAAAAHAAKGEAVLRKEAQVREANARAEMDHATQVHMQQQKAAAQRGIDAMERSKAAREAREANARAEMANAAKDSQRRAQEMAVNVAQLEKAQKDAAAKQKFGQDYNRNLAANSARLENQEREKADKNRQQLLDRAMTDRRNKAFLEAKERQDLLDKMNRDTRAKGLIDAAERQRLLDQTINDRQKRFEASNRLALQRDRQAQSERIRIEQEGARVAAELQEQQAQARKKQADASAKFGTQIGQTLKSTAAVMGSTSAALGYFGNVAVDEYAKFNQAFTESIAIMAATPEAEKKVEQAALNLSKASKFGPTELAKAFYFLASAGLTAEQSIAALPVVSNFAAAGAVNLEKATSLLMTAQAAMGMKAEDATENMQNLTRVTDVLTKASVMSEGTVTDFAFAMTREAGAAARAFGKDIEETTALIMNFSRQGIKGEVAGSYTARLTRFLADRSVENQAVFKKLGVKVFDDGPGGTGKMRNYADILDDLGKAFENLSDQGRTATLHLMGFEPRMQGAIMAALGGGKQMRKDIVALREASKEGFAAGVAEKQMTSFTNQMKLVRNQTEVAAIGIGEMLAPAFLIAGKAATFFLSVWEDIPVSLKQGIVYSTALFAVLAGGFAATVAAVVGFNFLFGGIPMILLGAAAAAMAVVAGLGAIGGVMFQQAGGWDMLKKKAEAAWEWLKPVRQAATDFFQTLHKVGNKAVKQLYEYVTDKLGGMFGKIDWEGFKSKLVETIKFAEFAISNFGLVWDYGWATIQYTAVKAMNDLLKDLFTLMPQMHSIWVATLAAMYKAAKFTFSSMGIDMEKYFKNIWYGISGQFHMIDWKGMWKDIDPGNIKVDLAGIKIENLQKLEDDLKDKMDKAGKKMKEGFYDFMKPGGVGVKANELLPFPDVEKVKEAGEKRGKDYVKGLDNGVKQTQASLIGSAEALSRILAYRDIAQEPDEVFKVHGGKKVEAIGAGTAAAQTWKDQLEALKGIENNTGELLKKNPVKLEGADLP